MVDFGNTHTFIPKTFVSWIDVTIEDLGYDLVVSTPTKAILTIGVSLRGADVVLVAHPFECFYNVADAGV